MFKRSRLQVNRALENAEKTSEFGLGSELGCNPDDLRVELAGYWSRLLVRVKEGNSAEAVLTKAQVKRLGDLWFLTGKLVGSDIPEAKVKGPNLWLRLNDVSTIEEYDTIDDYRSLHPGQGER